MGVLNSQLSNGGVSLAKCDAALQAAINGGALLWSVGTTWAAIYAQIVSRGSALVLVAPDSVPRVITTGTANLDNVVFAGLPVSPDTAVSIDMDDGVVLGPGGALRSKNILWRSLCVATRIIGSGPPCSFDFDGGGMIGWTDPSATNPIRLDPGGCKIKLTNRATLSGAGMPSGNPLVVVSGGGSLDITALAGSSIGDHTLGGGSFATASVTFDASVTVHPTYYAGFIGVSQALLDIAGSVTYDDSLVPTPSLATSNVQGAIDALKSMVPVESGVVTLGAGPTVVLSANVQITSKFTLTVQDTGAVPGTGTIYVSARSAGASFTIDSSGTPSTGADVYWQLWA